MQRILIAEDEARISSFLEKGLQARGFATTTVTDGLSATEAARDENFDLLILDIGLPVRDGHSVLEDLRRRGERMPVIILTARQGLADTVAGLEGGADDYVTKPFRFDELLARVRARLREGRQGERALMRAAGIELDRGRHRVVVEGRGVTLSAREFDLLEIFVGHPGQVLTREQLLTQVWGDDYDPGSNVVDVYIRHLRRKVGADVIETVRGVGYRLAETDA